MTREVDDKAKVLADAVEAREGLERTTLLVVCAAALFIMVSCFTALAYGLAKVNGVAEANRVVVCNLRDGYVQQLESNKKFTKANPKGGILLGVRFTRGDLDRQRVSLEQRLKDTEAADC